MSVVGRGGRPRAAPSERRSRFLAEPVVVGSDAEELRRAATLRIESRPPADRFRTLNVGLAQCRRQQLQSKSVHRARCAQRQHSGRASRRQMLLRGA